MKGEILTELITFNSTIKGYEIFAKHSMLRK